MTKECEVCGEESTVHKYNSHYCFSHFVDTVLKKARKSKLR